MRRMLEGIVWRMASTVLLLTGHMISDLRSTISGDKAKQILASSFSGKLFTYHPHREQTHKSEPNGKLP